MKTISEIRAKSGLSRAAFSQKYAIPIRTLEDWEAGKRKCPDYLVMLLDKAVQTDNYTGLKVFSPEFMRGLGYIYESLLEIMNGVDNDFKKPTHDPYPASKTFPLRCFPSVLNRAITRKHIPRELDQRMLELMNHIDASDWVECAEKPCPLELQGCWAMGKLQREMDRRDRITFSDDRDSSISP